jgi:hypothetical protein
MAGDEGVLADAPVVVDQVHVGVADAAVGDLDLDFVGAEVARGVAEGQQLCASGVDRETFDLRHGVVS